MRSFSLKGPFLMIVSVFLMDQATKTLVLDHLAGDPLSLPQNSLRYKVLPILDFVLVWNRGISWGLFNNAGYYNAMIFSALAVVISIVLGLMLRQTQRKLVAWSLGLIIGGALGNLVDRLRFGGVVDFIYFHWHSYAFPAFNIADAAITFGAGLMILEEVAGSAVKRQGFRISKGEGDKKGEKNNDA